MEGEENPEVRCESGIKFAGIVGYGIIETKCRSARCGAGKGVVVIHTFDVLKNELLGTKIYRNPPERSG